jgi:transglutaminase-like putative cysteine protease
MQMHIRHETVYRYDRPQKHAVQQLRLTPRRDPWQHTLRWAISSPGHSVEQQDAYGNVCHLVSVDAPSAELRVVAQGIVEVDSTGGLLPAEDSLLSPQVFLRATSLTDPTQALRAFAGRACPRLAPHRREAGSAAPIPEVRDLLDLAAAVRDAVRYQPGSSDVQHAAADALERGCGVCQDHAHLFVASCRVLGIPARYVSGYLYTGDAMVASHAWADAWLGGNEGWYSLDVTHGAAAGPLHCRLAVGRDYLDASPVRGMRGGGGEEEMKVSVFVARSPQEQQQQLHQQQINQNQQQQQQQQQ